MREKDAKRDEMCSFGFGRVWCMFTARLLDATDLSLFSPVPTLHSQQTTALTIEPNVNRHFAILTIKVTV